MWERRRGGKACIGCVLGISRETAERVSIYLAGHLSLSTCLPIYHLPIIYLSSVCIYLSISIISVPPSVCLSIYLPVYLSKETYCKKLRFFMEAASLTVSSLQAETPESWRHRSETGKLMSESQSEGETDVPVHTG